MEGKEEGRIFVGGLSWQTDERKLEDAFGRFGKVVDAQVPVAPPYVSVSAHARFARSISFVLSAVQYCWVRWLEGQSVGWKGGSVDCFCVPSNGDGYA